MFFMPDNRISNDSVPGDADDAYSPSLQAVAESGNPSSEIIHFTATDSTSPATDVDILRETLMDAEFYLGSTGAKEGLAWVQNGSTRILVSKEDAVRAESTLREGKITDSAESDREPFTPAILEVVVRISEQDCFLDPSKFWRAGSSVPLPEIKLNCIGIAPDNVHLAEDFAVAIKNLRHFLDIASSPGSRNSLGVVQGTGASSTIRFRHPVFKVSAPLMWCVAAYCLSTSSRWMADLWLILNETVSAYLMH
jgi:hypothetical protein